MANLAMLQNFDPQDWRALDLWGFNNAAHHNEIRQTLQNGIQFQNQWGGNLFFVNGGNLITFTSKQPQSLQDWLLYPVNWQDWRRFALRHQKAHNDMNTALALPGDDLMELDFEKPEDVAQWRYTHFSEHVAVRAKLGI